MPCTKTKRTHQEQGATRGRKNKDQEKTHHGRPSYLPRNRRVNKLFLHKYLASSINGTASIPYTFTTRIHTNATYTPETTFHITTCTRSNADGLTSTANKINTTILSRSNTRPGKHKLL